MPANTGSNEVCIQQVNHTLILLVHQDSHTKFRCLWFNQCVSLLFCHLDPGKTLPEALDYNTVWLQTVPGETDSKSGIPPSLVTLQIKDFLNGPGMEIILRHFIFCEKIDTRLSGLSVSFDSLSHLHYSDNE